tara:strand:+ start:233 stop:718 length:486 start_codon:yes stop_codon:yes gene_type:complete
MMKELREKIWFSGSGVETSFDDLVAIVKIAACRGSKIFIGTDSFVSRERINFASAICLYGEHTSRYFFIREYEDLNKFNILVLRITEEVRRTILLADFLYSKVNIDPKIIEVHIDVSPFGNKNATSKFSEMLQGYVQGAGYICKVKPNAWASQSVADKHSK